MAQSTDAETTLPSALASLIRNVAFPLTRRLRQQDSAALTPTQLSVLGAVHRHGPLSLRDLGERERLSAPTISKTVAALEALDAVERLVDPRDRRVCLVRTSRAGERRVERIRRERDEWLASQLALLDDDELRLLEQAFTVLERVVDGP